MAKKPTKGEIVSRAYAAEEKIRRIAQTRRPTAAETAAANRAYAAAARALSERNAARNAEEDRRAIFPRGAERPNFKGLSCSIAEHEAAANYLRDRTKGNLQRNTCMSALEAHRFASMEMAESSWIGQKARDSAWQSVLHTSRAVLRACGCAKTP